MLLHDCAYSSSNNLLVYGLQAFPEVKRAVQILAVQILAVGGSKSIIKLILNINAVGF